MYRGERFNGITHLSGALLALAGAVALIVVGALKADPWKIVSFSIYGTTLVFLYLSSTLYHSVRGRAKNVLRKMDHAAIYLLIAGTYTPFTLGVLRGAWGWSLFGVIWGLAVAGIVLKSTVGMRFPKLSLAVYLLMGWLVVIAARPLVRHVPPAGLAWLLAGGLAYTAGVAFYARPNARYAHFLWHLAVLAGTVCHFVAVLRYSSQGS